MEAFQTQEKEVIQIKEKTEEVHQQSVKEFTDKIESLSLKLKEQSLNLEYIEKAKAEVEDEKENLVTQCSSLERSLEDQ